jgi:hypothetical protein
LIINAPQRNLHEDKKKTDGGYGKQNGFKFGIFHFPQFINVFEEYLKVR